MRDPTAFQVCDIRCFACRSLGLGQVEQARRGRRAIRMISKIRKQRNTHQTSIAGLAEDQAGIAGLNRERRYVVSINRFLANTETSKPSSNR